ncbi:MAG TPA: AraC family transcriptional regulator [Acidisoma sp.]|jgi:AraC-like DNA-binding protein|nr:AraC family transcriptional regulator [Acidisoma sp.]
MDPLSDVLSLLKPVNYLSSGLAAEGAWSLQFPHLGDGIKCGAVVSGQCWLALDDGLGEVLLEAGDAFLLPSGSCFRLCSDLAVPPVEALPFFKRQGSNAGRGGIVSYRGAVAPGEDLRPLSLVSSRFVLSGPHAQLLLRMLPPVVHLRGDSRGDLCWAMEQMMRELREPQPGGFLVVEHLAHMILVQALRQHMQEAGRASVGWLFALTDPQIGAAMAALHAEPARHCTLGDLAGSVGMSRSSFAQKFKEMVGSAPMEYLTRWRVLVAGERLTYSAATVSAIALSLGYESESAFSTAFKRIMGCSPREYGRGPHGRGPHGRAGEASANLPDQLQLAS